MRKFVFAFMAVFLLAAPAFAAGKYAVVDMRFLASNCQFAQEAKGKLEREFKPEAESINALQEELKQKVEDMKVQAAALSPQAREDKRVEVQRLGRDLEDKKRAYARRVQNARTNMSRNVSALILTAVSEYGKEHGYEMIFDNMPPQVLYADESVDITKPVLAEVDRIYNEKKKK